MKRISAILTLLLASSSLCLAAGNRSVGFEVEWGYTGTLLTAGHRIYNDPQKGFIRDNTYNEWKYGSAGLVSLGVFARIGGRNELGLRTGYRTISPGRAMVPITVKYTRLFADRGCDGWKAFAEAGPGFSTRPLNGVGAVCAVGGGYRIAQTGNFAVDFNAAVHLGMDHPEIILESGEHVPAELTRYSTCGYAGLTFSVSFSF